MLQPPSHHIAANWTASPEETQDGDRWAAHCEAHLSSQQLQLTPMVPPEKTEYWPQIAEVNIKGVISVSSNSCIFPFTEKH